jgi:ABC-2 type transport system ATP-binding protein
MISVVGVEKRFGDFVALRSIDFEILDGFIYGLVGINGAGKSTLLRTISGIYRPSLGEVTYDGEKIFDNPSAKRRVVFVPDELYLPSAKNMKAMALEYKLLYGRFNNEKFERLAVAFELDIKKPFNSFSKGMKRQAATILALSVEPDYIFFDETFDGLDPFKRAYIKRLISEEVKSRGMTAIITSHSLKELEDICDKLAVLDKGGLVFDCDVGKISIGATKVQIALDGDFDRDSFRGLDIAAFSKRGSVATLVVRGDSAEIEKTLSEMNPKLLELLPLSLEEAFSLELSARGVGVNLSAVSGEEEKK